MPYMPRGVAQHKELLIRLNALSPFPQELGVVKFNYTMGDDWSGDPAIFFWITLSDEAAIRANLSQSAERVTNFITERIEFVREWDLIPYFYFRSQSEQAKLKDENFG